MPEFMSLSLWNQVAWKVLVLVVLAILFVHYLAVDQRLKRDAQHTKGRKEEADVTKTCVRRSRRRGQERKSMNQSLF